MRSSRRNCKPNTKVLSSETVEDVHQFGEPLCTVRIPFGYPLGDALFDVEAEDRETDAIERGLVGRELLENFDAEARFLHHPSNAADLTFDAVETRDDRLLLGLVQNGLTLA